MSIEVELKLNLDSKYASLLRVQPVIVNASISEPATHKLSSIYFDTPDLKLLDAGITLRMRHQSSSWIQTIKQTGNAMAGLHERHEWECVVAENRPDFTKIRDAKLIKFFSDQKLRDSIIPIFQTDVQRSLWQLAFNNGDRVELALDLGLLTSNKNQEPISEIELELKAGNTGRLFDIALELQNAIPLKIENVSKAQRGYAYFRPVTPKIFKANVPMLDKSMDANIAFKKIAWECMTHLQKNHLIVLDQSDEEGVHQMRVALRRLHSAFVFFRGILGRENSKALLLELSWLDNTLGKARDLDVFISQTLPAIIEHYKQHQGLLLLRESALEAKRKAYADIHVALLSQRYHRMLLMLLSWLENERWHEEDRGLKKYRLLTTVTGVLNKFHKRLLLHTKHFAKMRPEERHTLRVAAKKLRYSTEFFANLYPAKDTRKFIKQLIALQDYLGNINDFNVTVSVLTTLAGASPSSQVKEAIHIIEGWISTLNIQNIEKANISLRKLLKIKPYWL
jgi:triphosphatase